jgi:hypothetical protein
MYIFAKFVAGHIFLQNRDKINIKNSTEKIFSNSSPSQGYHLYQVGKNGLRGASFSIIRGGRV